MKLLNFLKDSSWNLGVKTVHGILDVENASEVFKERINQGEVPNTVDGIIEAGEPGSKKLRKLTSLANDSKNKEGLFLEEDTLKIGPCVTSPQKIICVGLNYKKHAEESGIPLPKTPILFNKFNNALTGHKSNVRLLEQAEQYDYEGELAIVIGKETSQVDEEDALSYVYGYCTSNDLSARDLQFQNSQWLLGKTCDGFCPIGPYLVSADELEDPDDLIIKTYVNGEVRQNSKTSDMIFSCKEIISFVSKHMTLYPGDIILTGTPEGVIMGYEESKRKWLKEGDEIVVEIGGLGQLSTRLVRG